MPVISREEFEAAVKACDYPSPPSDVYDHLAEATNDFPRDELAMFLAQLIHESAGFGYKEEPEYIGNKKGQEKYVDDVGLPGKDYHGRGYIPITWGTHYKAASDELGMGDLLLQNPELVAEETRLAVLVSVWYWTALVRPQIQGEEDCFGATTRAMANGAIECSGGFNKQAYNRYQTYLKVADVLDIKEKAKECGCYN